MSTPNAGPRRPKILFLVDIPGWAHDIKTTNIMRCLEDEFDCRKAFHKQISDDDIKWADLILLYYWEQYFMDDDLFLRFEGKYLVTGVCSHIEIEDERAEVALQVLQLSSSSIFIICKILFDKYKDKFVQPVYLTPNGVDTSFYTPGPRFDTIPEPGTLVVGWAGSLTNQGTHRGYYDIIVPAVERTPGVRLETAAREIKWRGKEEMREFYRSLDVHLIASSTEGGPNPGLEAAACGVPLISTRVGNMPELIRDGVNGFLVDRTVEAFADRLARLRDDVVLRRSMAGHILSDIQDWDWKKRVEPFRQMFRETLPRTGYQP